MIQIRPIESLFMFLFLHFLCPIDIVIQDEHSHIATLTHFDFFYRSEASVTVRALPRSFSFSHQRCLKTSCEFETSQEDPHTISNGRKRARTRRGEKWRRREEKECGFDWKRECAKWEWRKGEIWKINEKIDDSYFRRSGRSWHVWHQWWCRSSRSERR